jgi:hypothetical protein
MADAIAWVSRITTVAAEMALPGLIGWWLDRRWGTSFLMLVGFSLGLVAGFWHLLIMTGAMGRKRPRRLDPPPDKGPQA